jgi:hypothetical protein
VEIVGDHEEDYPGIGSDLALIIQSFRNSIGDINTPTYEWWFPEEGGGRRLRGA